MNLKKAAAYFIAGLMSVCLIACSGPQVSRVDSNEEIDLSGYWNDTDSRQVAEDMIADSFANQWITNYTKSNGRKPRVIVGLVLNKTEEHISTETFVKDLARSYINSGKVTFVASKDQRAEIRAERSDQAGNSKTDSAKSHGFETAADFMLKGQINSIVDANKKAQLKYYQVELELMNLETNETVWIGQKKIKKVISRKSYKA
ncbi:MAG: penicillin-binding protein activator LpoB [Endomicrobium sp.]|nr:penicillin-binding protein activator LpoB [Endomicrobium sp.]